MASNRDDFSEDTKRKLGDRVNWLCSNPDCRAPTKGPHTRGDKAISVGIAAHIHAAAPGGKRYDASQTAEERSSIGNAIWLCCNCGTLIDKDEGPFPAKLLREWKEQAERDASSKIGKPGLYANIVSHVFEFTLNPKNVRIEPERHDYLAVALFKNTGRKHMTDVEIEVEIPTVLVPERRTMGIFQADRSDQDYSLFLAKSDGLRMPVRVGDKREIPIPYRVDSDTYRNHKEVFDRVIKARVFIDGEWSMEIERRVEEMQNF